MNITREVKAKGSHQYDRTNHLSIQDREAERQSEMRAMVGRNDESIREEHKRETGEDIEFYKSTDHGQTRGGKKFISIP